MERYKSTFQKKNWITLKLSEIDHVKEIQAISFIWNHLKRQNALSGTAQEHKKEADVKIVIQKIIGLLSSGHNIKQIATILREDLYFVQLISTIYQQEFQLHENIQILDLAKHSGVSSFTSKFAKERQKIKGAGNRSAKLVEMRVNQNEDYVTFVFLQEPTHKFDTKVTQPPSMELVPDNLYTQQIRFENVFSLLKTDPNFTEFRNITLDQVKELLKAGDIKMFCDCPSFHWQGQNFNMTQLDASIFPTEIPPTYWNNFHKGEQLVCKHLDLMLANVNFFIPIMSSMFFKYLRNK